MATPQDFRAGDKRVWNINRVRKLRKEETDAEHALWQRLRGAQLGGLKFRRQHEFAGFVLDFYCPSERLAVEVDGGQHLTTEGVQRDRRRTALLQEKGLRVLRFSNTQVLSEIDAVLEAIVIAVEEGRRR